MSSNEEKAQEFVSEFPNIDPDKETIVVFGGNGYIGSRVCQSGLLKGFNVISISRRGKPPKWIRDPTKPKNEWINQVFWCSGDAFVDGTYKNILSNERYPIKGVISCVGAFTWPWKQKKLRMLNGESNINICNTASKTNNVNKFCFISAHDYTFFLTSFIMNKVLYGYTKGKRDVEDTINK